MKFLEKEAKGITLIALVVIIVVLIILATVSINLVLGENGIIGQAQKARENTRGASAKEEIDLWKLNVKTDNLTNSEIAEEVDELLNRLVENGLLKQEEADKLKNGETIKIGNIEISLGEITGGTGDGDDTTIAEKWYTEPGTDSEGNKTLIVTNGKIKLEIGDYVDYDPLEGATELSYTSEEEKNGYGDQVFTLKRAEGETETTVSYEGKWQVIGVSEEGQILIAPEGLVLPTSGEYTTSGVAYYGLKGQAGYENAITELDNISKLYGQGYGAEGARSINVDDINKVTGFNPNNVGVYDIDQTESGTKYAVDTLWEYGNEITYYWDGTDYPYYTATNGLKGKLNKLHSTNFNWYENGWKISVKATISPTAIDVSEMEKITTLRSNYYYYYPETLTNSLDKTATVGLTNGSKAFKALYTDASGSTSGEYMYWLSSPYVHVGSGFVTFGVRIVRYSDAINDYLFESRGKYLDWCFGYGVRPAVSLKSDIELTGNSEEGWKIVKD